MQANFTLMNIQGLLTKYTNKLLTPELQSVFSANDFILLTETWADEQSDISVKGFNVIQLNRVEKKSEIQKEIQVGLHCT